MLAFNLQRKFFIRLFQNISHQTIPRSLLHCHIQSHSMSGMAYVLIASDEGGTPDLPDYYSIKAFNTGLTDAANTVKQGVN